MSTYKRTRRICNGYPLEAFPGHSTYYKLKEKIEIKQHSDSDSVSTDKLAFFISNGKVSFFPSYSADIVESVVVNNIEHTNLCSLCRNKLIKLLDNRYCGSWQRRGPNITCKEDFQALEQFENSQITIEKQAIESDYRALSILLGIELKTLIYLERTAKEQYSEFTITTNHGRKQRSIIAPKQKLKAVQRRLLERLLRHYPTLPCVKGFTKGTSIADNARPHTDRSLVVSLDLKDFFPTITTARVVGLFKSFGFDGKVAHLLGQLTTFKGILPQGAPTSPIISNMIAFKLDKKLYQLSNKYCFRYTRYADDLTFSFKYKTKPRMVTVFLEQVQGLIEHEGFEVNAAKTKVMSRKRRQTVTGLVVNKQTNISRIEYQRLRAIVHNCRKLGLQSQAKEYYIKKGILNTKQEIAPDLVQKFYSSLKGKIAFVKVGNEQRYNKLREEFDQIVTR